MDEGEERARVVRRKIALAACMLMFSSHKYPGVRGWELRRRLGRDYLKVIEALNQKLSEIGMRVKVVFEEPSSGSPSQEDFDRARFFVTIADPLSLSDIVAAGWNIDDVAILAATASYLFSRDEKASEREIYEMLESKFPRWKVEAALERFIRKGYFSRSEDGTISIGWRLLAEVDKRELLKNVLGFSSREENVSRNE